MHASLSLRLPMAVRLGLLAALVSAGAAMAAGESSSRGAVTGGGTDGTTQAPAVETQRAMPDVSTCPKGQIWSRKKKTCIAAHGEIVPDEDLVDYAYALAKAERFAEAIEVLDMMQHADTPKAWNYRGYATRKLGRVEEGIGYYLKAVALDPRYPEVREYLGEAYVSQGRIDLAREQLEAIRGICGTTCENYEDLAAAIQKAHPL